MGKDTLKKKGHGSLYGQFLKMTLLPLLGMGFIMVLFCSITYKQAMQSQIKKGLRTTCISVLLAYDTLYDGDYNLSIDEDEIALLYKGNQLLSGDYQLIDSIKEETEHDISIFFYDLRMLTTLTDEEGTRCIGYKANDKIVKDVLEEGKEKFYSNVTIDHTLYLAYYIPILSQNGTCIGMIAVAIPATDVNHIINANLSKLIAIMLLLLIVTILCITVFCKKELRIIRKIINFMREMSKGNLSNGLDYSVVSRTDELGDIGRFAVHLQNAFRKLVERDELTGLLNRRTGESRLQSQFKKTVANGEQYAVAIGDIDFFKKVNDTYGHEAGDAVLRMVSHLLNEDMKDKGFVARWGGEEFLFVFEGYSVMAAADLLESILEHIRKMEVVFDGNIINVTMTFGVTQGGKEKSVNKELKVADGNLYYGKENGRNRVVVHY